MITFDKFLDALNKVEASGRKKNVPPGDNSKAIGPLQIHREYYQDADAYLQMNGILLEACFAEEVSETYEMCQYWLFARMIAHAYFERHAPKALREGNWEVLARIHNGGPRGHLKKATIPYWDKVKKELEKIS